MLDQFRSKITDAGRVVIPSAFRKELQLADGDEVVITRNEYGVLITPLSLAIRRSQELVGQYIPADADLVGDLRLFRDQNAVHD